MTTKAILSYTCDHDQGLNFNQDQKKSFGFITSLTCGAVAIPPDIKVIQPPAIAPNKDDTASKKELLVVAVLNKVEWAGHAVDLIKFEGVVSLKTQQLIQGLIHQELTSTAVQLSFIVYEYDNLANVWHAGLCSYEGTKPATAQLAGEKKSDGDTLKSIYGTMRNKAGELTLEVSQERVDSDGLIIYELKLDFLPTEAKDEQKLFYAPSKSQKFIKNWGGERG